MRLISLKSNQPSFHPVTFNRTGISIIVGKQVAPHGENDGNTYNGVGKSLVLHLIHFCLGSNKIDSFAKKLTGWDFTLKFEIDGEEYYSTRTTDNQDKINFCGELLTPNTMRQKMLLLCFGITNSPKYMTWNTLFSRFIRRYRSCYEKFDTFVPKESDYSKILNDCYLLGIDIDLIVSKKDLREKQSSCSKTEKAIKNDDLFKQYYLGNNDVEIDGADLLDRISKLENEILSFKVSQNYHELEKEADDTSYQKKVLENRRVLICNNIKNIEESFKENSQIKDDKVFQIYESANIEIPELIKKNIDDVLKFHKELLLSRNIRLRKELNRQKSELKEIDSQIYALGQHMDELLSYLNSHGALDEYVALTRQLSSLKNESARIQEYKKILKAYKDTALNVKADLIANDKETERYLEDFSEYLSDLNNKFRGLAQKFYPKKRSGLVLKNNSGENMIRFKLDARIEDDSSDGVNEVRIFCFDLLLFICKRSKMRFIAHDSRLFANMDPRQREMLFRIVFEKCQFEDLQYICSINEDSLLSFKSLMSEEEYEQIITSNIVLELKDDAPESKLLGVQIDIDLEGKNSSFDDVK